MDNSKIIQRLEDLERQLAETNSRVSTLESINKVLEARILTTLEDAKKRNIA